MVTPLFDTNILIDFLSGRQEAIDEIKAHRTRAISIITKMEVLVGTDDARTRAFIERFDVISLDDKIAERAIVLRQTMRMKLPDAIIYATAQVNGLVLVTRNTKDFSRKLVDVRIPYEVTLAPGTR